jgi:hypothetical protein
MAWSFCHPALPAKGAGSWQGSGSVLRRETAGSTTAGDEGFNPAYLFSDYLALPYPRLRGQKENSRLPRVDGLGPVREEEVLRGITACFERVDAAWGEQEIYEKARKAWRCLARLMQYPALPQVEVLAGRPRPGRDARPRVLPPEGGFDLGRKLARIHQAEWAAGQVALEFPSIHWWLQSIIKLLRIP